MVLSLGCPMSIQRILQLRFLHLWSALVQLFINKMTTIFVSTVPGERAVVTKERRAGAYRLSAYYFAKISSELPLIVIVPIVFYSIIYWMAMIGGVWEFLIFIGVNLLSCLCTQVLSDHRQRIAVYSIWVWLLLHRGNRGTYMSGHVTLVELLYTC